MRDDGPAEPDVKANKQDRQRGGPLAFELFTIGEVAGDNLDDRQRFEVPVSGTICL